MKRMRLFRKLRRDSRGSALLVSLMVIVGLSLLGLGFVAISETESAIAKNQQNALQTQAIAEAGAKLVVEWFQDPAWGEANGMPTNTGTVVATGIPAAGAIKTLRNIPGTYTGLYKPRTTAKLLDKPYRPGNDERFWGDEDNADIIINKNTGGQAMLDTFNNKLLASSGATASGDDLRAGEVTEIKIFAPPIVGGTLVGGFWNGGQRYGVATVKVTAQQFQNPAAHTGVIASHSVRLVVGELPLPIPAGPIQGNANVAFGGNFRVHWGMETATGDLTPSLNLSALPWANAYERPHYEHGYEPGTTVALVVINSPGIGYTSAPTVTFSCVAPCTGINAAATATVTGGGVTSVAITNRGTGYNPQYPPTVTFTGGGATTDATGTASVGSEVWPIIAGTNYDQDDYFHEVLAKNFQDPFYGARSIGDNSLDGVGPPYPAAAQLFPYAYTNQERQVSNPSYAFQWQDQNIYPLRKRVIFPVIRYAYWKRITQQGRGYRGIYYFAFDNTAGSGFKKFNTGPTRSMATWVNTKNSLGLGAGVYFFDTKNSADPQAYAMGNATRDNNVLTPVESWNSSDFGALGAPSFLMQGFIYSNAKTFGTTGQGSNGTTVQANFPGDPFRDIGYPYWCTAVSMPPGPNCPAANAWSDCSGAPCRSGAGDGVFSCQDLNNNGRCDVVVMQAPSWNSNDPGVIAHNAPYAMPACGSGCTSQTAYIPKVWKSVAQATADYGAPCTVPAATYDGTNAAATDCSEPHEPYLNIIYPDQAANNNGDPKDVVIGWEPPGSQTYRPKKVDNAGNVVPCPTPPNVDLCVSNAYDVDGAVVPLSVILQGILYQENVWGSEGNAWFYGSVLVNNTINLSSGTADVWFDEKLLKGTWAPPGMPRVIVFNEQTDESSQ